MVSMLVTMLLVSVVYTVVEEKFRKKPRFAEAKEAARS